MRFYAAAGVLFLIITSLLAAAGLAEDDISTWYGDLVDTANFEDVENTGLTTFPTLTMPGGGEYEAMAKAYAAVARDPSFLFANPAGSSDLENTELAFYYNNVIADASMNSFVYTTRHEEFGVGVGGNYLYVPFTEYDDFGVQTSTGRYTETIVAANLSYNFLNSFYFNGVAVGGNAKIAYRHIPEEIVSGQSAAGFMFDMGALSRFNVLKFYPSRARNAAAGFVIRNLGPNVRGDPLPAEIVLGIAYQPLRPWVIAFDVTQPITPFSRLPAESLQFATGTAVTVTDFFEVRGGFGVDGGNPKISLGGSVAIEKMIISMNYTLDMTTQLSGFDRFSVNVGFDFGDRGREEREAQVRELYLDALVAFADGDLEQAITLCEAALEIDRSFQPANETLEMATRMLRLQNEMESIRTGQ